MFLFSDVAVTDDQKEGDFKQQKLIFSQLWRLEIGSQSDRRAMLPSKALRKNFFAPLPSSGGCSQSLVFFDSILTNFYLCLQMTIFLSVSVPIVPLSSKDTSQIKFIVHLKLTKSAKILFFNCYTFTDSKVSGFT